jgi:hypothetical protein
MRTFTDPIRSDEWRVLIKEDATCGLHMVFAGETVQLHPPEGSMATSEDVSEARLHQLFLLSCREIWHANEVRTVRWEVQENLETWTWFESLSGERLLVREQVMFPFLSGSELAEAFRGAERAGDQS